MGDGEAVRRARVALDNRRLVMVVGAAGIGKSTLARKIVDGRDVALGQSLKSLDAVAYHPLSHALRTDLRGSTVDVAAEVTAQLAGRTLFVEDLHWADRQTRAVIPLLVGRVPTVVTCRLRDAVPASAEAEVVGVRPLTQRVAQSLARRLHPGLDDDALGRLVHMAGGNPLLIRELAAAGRVSPTLIEAVATRVSMLPAATLDVLGRLALYGRPATAAVIGWTEGLDGSGLVEPAGDGLRVSHALIAHAIIEQLDDSHRRRLHADLARGLDDKDAAGHHLLAGDPEAAVEAAIRGAQFADAAERAALLALAVHASGDGADDRLRLGAAAASLDANQVDTANSLLDMVASSDPQLRAEVAWHRSQAAWLNADIPKAESWCEEGMALVRGSTTRIEAHLVVERATQIVRLRTGDPTIVGIATAAVEVAERAHVDRAKAHNALGLALAHTGRHGWDEQYRVAAAIARSEGDHEQECAAQFWAVSAYGLYGSMQAAQKVGEEMMVRSRSLGLRRWYNHFLGAYAVHRFGTGTAQDDLVAVVRQLLGDDPLFRNRSQVELALATGLIDRGDYVGAAGVIAVGHTYARTSEDRSLLAAVSAELALVTDDEDLMRESLAELGRSSQRFFGIGAVAESAAIYMRVHRGDATRVPRLGSALMPIMDVVALEQTAFEAWAAHAPAASNLFAAAAEAWSRRGFARFAARAWCCAADLSRGAGDRRGAERSLRSAAACTAANTLVPAQRSVERIRAELREDRIGSLLTQRERQVLRLVGDGLTTGQIAAVLEIARATVDSHIESARLKLGASTRAQAAALVSTGSS